MHTEITPNVYQISQGANIFLLKTGEGELTVIDTGMAGATQKILTAAHELGYTPNMIQHILITHADFDHVGSLGGLVRETGARVYSGFETKTFIEKKASPPHIPAIMNLLMTPMQKLLQKRAYVDQIVEDDEVLPIGGGIRALAAPGHSPDNFVFYWEREGVLFAPDLLNKFGKSLALSNDFISWNTEQVKLSARRVLEMQPKIICVGHGDAVTSQEEMQNLLESL